MNSQKRAPGQSRTPSPGNASAVDQAPAGEGKPSYLQDLYHVFWKPIFMVVCVLHWIPACLLAAAICGKDAGYAYLLAILIAVPVAYGDLAMVARWLKLDSGPIVDWRQGATIIAVVGYALCLAVVVVLLLNDTHNREYAPVREQGQELEKRYERQMLSNPAVQRGIEAFRRQQEARRSAETQPSPPPPTR